MLAAARQISPLARGILNPKSGPLRPTPIYGITLHTTGSAPVTESGTRTPAEWAIDYYREHAGPTYLIAPDGQIFAITPDERIRTHHVLIRSDERAAMNTGAWWFQLREETARHWRARWPGASSPLELIPGRGNPKDHYIGIEVIPVKAAGRSTGVAPMRPGLKFSRSQHDAIVRLARDIAARHGFPPGWERTSRLTGHADLNPLRRQNSGGGWDPGWLRQAPMMDLEYIQHGIGGRRRIGGTLVGVLVLTGAGAAGWYAWKRWKPT